MTKFIVTGGVPLRGEIRVSGAKNAALPILAACLVGTREITLWDCPLIRDTENMLAILEALGVRAWREGGALCLDPGGASGCVMPSDVSKELRSSIFMLGPLLTRFHCAVCTYPGGCEIGNRPIDLHLKGLSMLGVRISEEYGRIFCDGRDMSPAEIHLDYPSVGATENIIMAALRLKGETTIYNAAREPEIEDLQRFLNAMGFCVSGAGTSNVRIVGTDAPTKAVEHRVMPDRIVAGTLLCAGAITGGELTLTNVCAEHLGSVTAKLREAGSRVLCQEGVMKISSPKRPGEIKLVETLPYPGFPTDMQAQLFALCCVAEGTGVIVENVFENRFKHGPELARMGAVFTQKDRTTIIRGVGKLTGAPVSARDLRGGAGLTLAGLCAVGETVIHGAEFIDRGYEKLDAMLRSVGANITREEDE